LITEYVDTGVSGAKEKRPALDQLMGDARKRKLDAILVWRFDRFARSTKHLLTALEEFRSLGMQFISYQENMDTTSPLGQALFTIVAAVAQLERDIIRERITSGVANARAKS
jgi:DNA invertase Pin-like site-specific DNA recombinase